MSEVFDRVKKVIVQQLSIENEATITPEASFIDLGADSLDTIELIMAFTDEFGIEFPEEESENILTVQDVVNYIESHT